MGLCFPTPHFYGTAALTHSDLLGEGLTEQWPSASHPSKCSGDCTAANAQSLCLGASLPWKKFTRLCSSSVSGFMENHNTHLAPGFTLNILVPTPANMVVLQSPLGPLPVWWPHSLYQMSSQQENHLSPCGPRTPWTSLSAPGDSSFPPEHRQVPSYRASDSAFPLFIES